MSGRTTWLVCYDISDPTRLREVHSVVSSHGVMLQYSVYRCSLTDTARVRLRGELLGIIDQRADRVLFVALGPTGGQQVRLDHLGVGLPEEDPGTHRLL